MIAAVTLSADRLPLVRDVGWNRTENVYAHPDRKLDYDVFLYVAEGAMQVTEEGTSFRVGAREYLFLKRGLHHWGMPDTEAGTSWYWIHFATEEDERTMYSDHEPLPELAFWHPDHYRYRIELPKRGRAFPGLEERLRELTGPAAPPSAHRMTRLSARAHELFLDLHDASRSIRAVSASRSLAERVMTYLTEHADEPFSAVKLGAALNLNYSHLSAAFRRATGQTVIEAHTKLRMSKAAELMRGSSLSVAEIGERVGYANPFYFTRVFKKVFGQPPIAYMRQFYRLEP